MLVDSFENRLKKAMSIKNIKSIDLAEMLNVHRGIISKYINGKYKPKYDRIYEIAKVLNINEAWLMGYEVPMDEEIEIIDEKGFLEMLDIWLADDDVPIEIKRQAYEKIKAYLDKEERK